MPITITNSSHDELEVGDAAHAGGGGEPGNWLLISLSEPIFTQSGDPDPLGERFCASMQLSRTEVCALIGAMQAWLEGRGDR